MASNDWGGVKDVLCVRLDNMGDVLLTTPAICAMKHGGVNRRVTLLTSPSGAEAARLVPEIDEIIVYEAPWMKATDQGRSSSIDRAIIERLRTARFEAAVIFTVYSQNPLPAAMLCYLADIPLRLAHCRENPYQLLTDWVREPEPDQFVRHEVRRQLDLIAAVGLQATDDRLRLKVPNAARTRVRRLLSEIGVEITLPWLIMHTGSTAPSRRYPPEHFAVSAERLAELGYQIVFTGETHESELIATIRDRVPLETYSLCGQLRLAELAAAIELAPLLVSNNTGPVHVAAAVGTPVVDLYALTNPQHTPWRVPHRVLFHDVPCKYCYKSVCPQGHHDCLQRVDPEEVVRAVLDLHATPGLKNRPAIDAILAETSACTP